MARQSYTTARMRRMRYYSSHHPITDQSAIPQGVRMRHRSTTTVRHSSRSFRRRGQFLSDPLETNGRDRHSPLPDQPNFWRSPLLWLGLLVMLIVAAIPIIDWYRTVYVIAILASDVSNSGLADPSIGKTICRHQTQALKPNDFAIDLLFADTTEPIRSSPVETVTQLFPRCNLFETDHPNQARPDSLGSSSGTSPIVLLERIQTQVEIQRRSGNTNPVAAVIWLQAAEPGPGLPELDFAVLGQHIQQVTAHHGYMTIIGPTGSLRENLETLSLENPNLRVCSIADQQTCIQRTFAAARTPLQNP